MPKKSLSDLVLDTIDIISARKNRPNLIRIFRHLNRLYDLSLSTCEQLIQKLVTEEKVICVTYKGNISYRNALKWKKYPFYLKKNMGTELPGSLLTNAISELVVEEPDYLNSGVPYNVLEQHLLSMKEVNINKDAIKKLLRRELKLKSLRQYDNGNYFFRSSSDDETSGKSAVIESNTSEQRLSFEQDKKYYNVINIEDVPFQSDSMRECSLEINRNEVNNTTFHTISKSQNCLNEVSCDFSSQSEQNVSSSESLNYFDALEISDSASQHSPSQTTSPHGLENLTICRSTVEKSPNFMNLDDTIGGFESSHDFIDHDLKVNYSTRSPLADGVPLENSSLECEDEADVANKKELKLPVGRADDNILTGNYDHIITGKQSPKVHEDSSPLGVRGVNYIEAFPRLTPVGDSDSEANVSPVKGSDSNEDEIKSNSTPSKESDSNEDEKGDRGSTNYLVMERTRRTKKTKYDASVYYYPSLKKRSRDPSLDNGKRDDKPKKKKKKICQGSSPPSFNMVKRVVYPGKVRMCSECNCADTKNKLNTMISCTSCSNKGHQNCALLTMKGSKWFCTNCRQDNAKCRVCKNLHQEDTGVLYSCSLCGENYHRMCHIPKIELPIPNLWHCQTCAVKEEEKMNMEYTTAGDKYFGENPPDFRMWSSSDVCDYFTKYFNDDVVKLFRKEEIDGHSLRILEEPDVLKMSCALGTRLKILMHVLRLQLRTNNLQEIWNS